MGNLAKGDADNLRADLADGYAKVANLLLEAFSCAPLSGAELRVCMFIMRRTYGWAGNDRTRGKMDTITAAEITKATGVAKDTVHAALKTLCRSRVLLTGLATADNRRRYGINPDVNSWGLPEPDWTMYRVTLKDARDGTLFNAVDSSDNPGLEVPPDGGRTGQKQPQVSLETTTGVVKNDHTCSQKQPQAGATSPVVPGPEDPPKDRTSLKTNITDNDVTPSAPAEHPAAAPLAPANEPPASPEDDDPSNDDDPADTTGEQQQPTKEQREAEREAKRLSDEATLAEVRAMFSTVDLPHVDDFIGMVRGHRANRRLALSAELRYTRDLLELRTEPGMTSDAFNYGLGAAIRKDVDAVNYAKKAARGYDGGTRSTSASPSGPRHSPPTRHEAFSDPQEAMMGWFPETAETTQTSQT